MLSQTYLSRYSQFLKKSKLPSAKYVSVTMRVNRHLGPSEEILSEYKTSHEKDWDTYAFRFTEKILSDPLALEKIDQLILDSLTQDVVLMCYESEKKYGNHCHRFLLLDIAEDRAKAKDIPVRIQRKDYLL